MFKIHIFFKNFYITFFYLKIFLTKFKTSFTVIDPYINLFNSAKTCFKLETQMNDLTLDNVFVVRW